MKTFRILFIYSIICAFISCDTSSESTTIENDSTENTSTPDKKEKELSPLFAVQIEPSQPLAENEVMNLVSKEYPNQPAGCECGADKNCYDRALLTTHYFRENSTEKAIAIIGNSCDQAAHAESGWCDAAILSLKDGNWRLDKHQKDIGGGGTFGSAGDIGDIFQIGENEIGIEIGFGDVHFGALYEGVNILAYYSGEVKSVTNIQTSVDNRDVRL